MGAVTLSWVGTSDSDWDHYELYYLVDPVADADDTSTHHSNYSHQGNNSADFYFTPGRRVSFALYSVDAAGNKSVTKTSVTPSF
ncbi:hypothetical protein BRE01_64880 [Brevibacillus reuszeri]|uniref:Fibronectin type-III domain-containing protein n=1 Tax=Brevibacillus reuszeri TaxID=54915 RepID=A0ABQ0TXY9_9BACL|nr:hypothetical protein BRE01_64880 [Brevibacillus reuszeri]